MRDFTQPKAILTLVGVLGVILVLFALQPKTALADVVISLDACKSVRWIAVPQGRELLTVRCGRTFSSRDPYIAIVTRVRDVVQIPRIDGVVQIYDPDQALVESYQWGQDIQGLTTVYEFWDVAVLPIATASRELASQLPDFQKDIVQVKNGRAFKDRLGTWTVRVTVNRQTHSLTFMLESN